MKNEITLITCAAAAVSFTTVTAHAQSEPPKKLEFALVKGVNPEGKGSYSGKVSFERENQKEAFKVTWTLSDGTVATGWGVSYPKSPYIAVVYGKNAGAVALYQLEGEGFTGQWAPAKENATIGSYSLKRSTTKYQYSFTDGSEGAVTIAPHESIEGVTTMKWKNAGGSYAGFGVAEDSFLAAGSAAGGEDMGIAIYKFTSDTTATGKWYLSGAPGCGAEELKLISVDGKEAPQVEATGAAGAEEEVRAIGESLKGSKEAILKLKPTAAQIGQIAATAEDAKILAAYSDNLFASLPESGLQAKEGQTEILVTSGDDLPGGYAQQAAHLKEGLQVYGFKYVAPGEKTGMAFDGLVKLDGTWVMIPKMFRAFGK